MILLKNVLLYGKNDSVEESKILLDIDLKVILLDHQNNKKCSKKVWYSSNWFHIIIFIVKQNYFSDLYPKKF